MCAKTNINEKRILTLSALISSGFAMGGLVVGLLVSSLVILFDGMYSLVSLLLTILSLIASRYIQKPSDEAFQFGRAALEPAVIAVKGAVILIVVCSSLYSAVVALFTGGEVDVSIATLFGIVNVIGCGVAWLYMNKLHKRSASDLIDAEVKQWKMDTLLSVAVTVGFILAWLLTLSPLAEYAVYTDPVMMLAMSFYFLKVPFEMLKSSLREIFMMAPSEEICNKVDQGVLAAGEESDQLVELSAVTKIGRELWVDVDIKSEDDVIAVEDIEHTRRTLHKKLSKLPFNLQLSVNIAS
ncbi:cation diffusion facilitator family transporter [Vibrio diazotrophicus]|uniref:cation diffusion facilitator family transporter n=1 Tax=Vibrio diazotrophicus TaxID=685 RepID=UPI00142DAB55|nr:cation diffusion facilitator family transporter [Vibrio diazotrophicus]NIY91169.1 cation diffusion facilitator family transporter [Vibrio diazotrophicus]